jgi:hypothetical protein
MDLANISGKAVDNTKVNGSIIRCMDKDTIYGKTAGNMKEATIMIGNMVQVAITGLTVKNSRANGPMERDKVKVASQLKMDNQNKVSGKTIND